MADTKLIDMAAATSVVGTDVIYVVTTPGGTPGDKKITVDNFVLSIDGIMLHNNLGGLTTGDPHTQYVLSAGRSGGQVILGGTTSGPLTLSNNATSYNAGAGNYVEVASGIFRVYLNATRVVSLSDASVFNRSLELGTDPLGAAPGEAGKLTLWTDDDGAGEPSAATNKVVIYAWDYAAGDSRLKVKSETGSAVYIGNGSVEAAQLVSTIATGSAPIGVQSTTKVNNLNADQVDGKHETDFALLAGRTGGQVLYGGLADYDVLDVLGSPGVSAGGGTRYGDAIFYAGINSPAQITANQNNYAPSLSEVAFAIRINADAARTITGLGVGGFLSNSGKLHCLINVGTFPITLAHESASSAADNRFNFSCLKDIVLPPSGSVLLWNDSSSSRWRDIGGSSRGFPPMFRQGLTWARNSTDTTNDVDVAVGKCRDSTDSDDLVLGTAITKQLDAAWSVGTNAGGLDAGSRANNTWYYIHLIKRPDTGVVDVLLSTSSVSPTMPTNYTLKRLIGAIRTGASLLSQVRVDSVGNGYYVSYLDPTTNGLDIDVTNSTTARTTRTLPYIPPISPGFRFDANVSIDHASVQAIVWLSNPNIVDAAPSLTAAPLATIRMTSTTAEEFNRVVLMTDALGRITDRSSTTTTTLKLCVLGYFWPNDR